MSKLCNVLFAQELARRTADRGVTTYALHPGVVASDIWRRVPWPARSLMTARMLTTEQGAATSLYCATSPEVAKAERPVLRQLPGARAQPGGHRAARQDPLGAQRGLDRRLTAVGRIALSGRTELQLPGLITAGFRGYPRTDCLITELSGGLSGYGE